MDNETPQTAYLREFATSGQCELLFSLKKEFDFGVLQEEVKAVRQATDTVESLLQHIVNKIKKSIKTLKEEENGAKIDTEAEIIASLRNSITQKPIKGKMVLKNLISTADCLEFSIFDQNYFVVINAPFVKELKLPKLIYAHFDVRPCKLYVCFTDNNKCQFFWFKSKDKISWELVAKSYRYKPADGDIGCYIKVRCTPCNDTMTGPFVEDISACVVEELGDLPRCPFEDRHAFTTAQLEGDCFRLVSYNILSVKYTDDDKFAYCPPRALSADYRKQLIAKELLGYQADIICLQEVDSGLYTSYYKDTLKNKGYMSFYHRKGNRIPEGLACFFNKSRFKKIDNHQVLYNEEIKQSRCQFLWNIVKSNPDLKEDFIKQMTSLQVTVLKHQIPNKSHIIIVANTHLFYRPEAKLLRLIQASIATTYLNWLRQQHAGKGKVVTVIVCGDFNSVPTSAVFEFMTKAKIAKNDAIFSEAKIHNDLTHKFKFESVCGTPKYTNYTEDFKDCLDYIYVEKSKIRVKAVVPFPEDNVLGKYEGLPNEVFPSDHLALVADLQLV